MSDNPSKFDSILPKSSQAMEPVVSQVPAPLNECEAVRKILKGYAKLKIDNSQARAYRFVAVDFISSAERGCPPESGSEVCDLDPEEFQDLTSEEVSDICEYHACPVEDCSETILEDGTSFLTTHYLHKHTVLDNFTLCDVPTCPEMPHHLPSLRALRKHLKELIKGGVTCEVKHCQYHGVRFSGVRKYKLHATAAHPELGLASYKQQFVATTAAEDDETPFLELTEAERDSLSS